MFLLLGLFAADRLGGIGMKWINRHTGDLLAPKFRYLTEDLHEDVLLIGASRYHQHYVPSIIAPKIGMSVYNCGI